MKNKESGITLITLAVTIIVMIILSAVAINLSIGDKGIIGQTQNAIGGYENSTTQEQESANALVAGLNEAMNGGNAGSDGKNENISESPEITIIDWDWDTEREIGIGIVTISTNASYTTEYKIGNGTWGNYQNDNKEVPNGSIIYARYKDKVNDNNVSQIVSKIVKDTNPPILTGNVTETTATSTTVTVQATDEEIGMPNPILYKYYIKTQDESEYNYVDQNNSGTYQYTDLNGSTIYQFLITADDIAGNTGTIKFGAETDEDEIPNLVIDENIFFTQNPEGPTNSVVNVTIRRSEESKTQWIEYSIDNENNYVRYENVVNMTDNGRIYARVTNGRQTSNSVYYDVTNIDKEKPTGTVELTDVTTQSMTATVTEVTDGNGGGMPSQIEYNFYIRKTTEEYGEASYTGTYGNYNFTGLDHNTDYEVKVTFKDLAGNEGEAIKTQKTIKVPDLGGHTTFTLSDTRYTNKPITVEIGVDFDISGYTLQYSTDGRTYQNYTNEITIDEPTTISARLWDGRNNTGNYGGAVTQSITNVDRRWSDLEVLIKREQYVDENTRVTDSNHNSIVIPAGFKPTPDATTIGEGIVIEDKEGNQFVWIPVGDLYLSNEEGAKPVTINYNRYAYTGWKINGTDSNTNNSAKIQPTNGNTEYFAEAINTSEKNSAERYKGYYIGRFESGKDTNGLLKIYQGLNIYNEVNESNAEILASGMYSSSSSSFSSKLTSSYAWDTALEFLRLTGNTSYLTNSTQGNYYNTQYGGKSSANTSALLTTGATAKVNNIYDLGGNVYEWTTEKYSNSEAPCVARGGFFGFTSQDEPVIGRLSASNTADVAIGFRVALFVNQIVYDGLEALDNANINTTVSGVQTSEKLVYAGTNVKGRYINKNKSAIACKKLMWIRKV